MSFNNIQVSDVPGATDYPFLNNSGADIPADTVVALDTTISDALSSKTGIGITLPSTGGNPTQCIGVTLETIPNGSNGRVRCIGPIAVAKCDGAITVGGSVDASATTAGRIKAHAAGKIQIGVALVTGADAEFIPFMLATAVNA